MLKEILNLVPARARTELYVWSAITRKYGHYGSVRIQRPVDRHGAPLPWFTYPAIEYLHSLNLGHASVFEYGCGFGSLFFSARVQRVWSVESNPQWASEIESRASANQSVLLRQTKDAYVSAIDEVQPPMFDIVIIDGAHRVECAEAAEKHLKPGGFIILDNSERYPEVRQNLRSKGLIEVDFHGLGPINGYSWTTTLFLTRDYTPAFRSAEISSLAQVPS